MSWDKRHLFWPQNNIEGSRGLEEQMFLCHKNN
jgi:hypothetical protein